MRKPARVQTTIRMEKHMLKVLKALAEYYEISLADLVEAIVLHSFEGNSPFAEDAQELLSELKRIYGMTYDAHTNCRFHTAADKERLRKQQTAS